MQKLVRKITTLVRCNLNLVLSWFGLKKKKVFAIGFNKTGTTSIHRLMGSLGFLSYHGEAWRSCDDIALLNSYDCFSDGIPKDLAKLDRLFPGSKFILQVRELDTWVYSRLAHNEKDKKNYKANQRSTWEITEATIQKWIRQRNDHHISVLDYFANRPEDLLIVNFIRDDSAATKIANFLGFSGDYQKRKANVNPNKTYPPQHIQLFSAAMESLGLQGDEVKNDILCPGLVSSEQRHRYPVDTTRLSVPSTAL